MTEQKKDIEDKIEPAEDEQVIEQEDPAPDTDETLNKQLQDADDKYIRLYADFENYKKVSARNRDETLKYANESLMTDILTVIDHLDLALQHSLEEKSSGPLVEGVQLTLKELNSVLEKHGLKQIEAMGKPFDPAIHHAISQIESEDSEAGTVVKEFRKGYMLKERVIRAAMVGVSVKPDTKAEEQGNTAEDNG